MLSHRDTYFASIIISIDKHIVLCDKGRTLISEGQWATEVIADIIQSWLHGCWGPTYAKRHNNASWKKGWGYWQTLLGYYTWDCNYHALIWYTCDFLERGGDYHTTDVYTYTGLILGLNPANERHRYKVTASLIDWVQTLNQPQYTSWSTGVYIITYCLDLDVNFLARKSLNYTVRGYTSWRENVTLKLWWVFYTLQWQYQSPVGIHSSDGAHFKGLGCIHHTKYVW